MHVGFWGSFSPNVFLQFLSGRTDPIIHSYFQSTDEELSVLKAVRINFNLLERCPLLGTMSSTSGGLCDLKIHYLASPCVPHRSIAILLDIISFHYLLT